ncbi:hypothetical protein [Cyclobacterium xiamenense]
MQLARVPDVLPLKHPGNPTGGTNELLIPVRASVVNPADGNLCYRVR